MKDRIIVFGGLGFIGSDFVRLIDKAFDILICDNYSYSANHDAVKDCTETTLNCDISNREEVEDAIRIYRPKYIINFAAETHVDNSIHGNRNLFMDTNTLGVFNILESIKRIDKNIKFVQVSTDEVYGDLPLNSGEKFNVDYSYNPSSVYSVSKASADMLCKAYHRTFGLNVCVTHCGNNYGEWQYPEKMIPFWIGRLLSGQKIPIYGNGLNVRDWIYVRDHTRALFTVLESGVAGAEYLIGSNNERSNLQLAYLLLKIVKATEINPESWIEFVEDRKGHDKRYAINNESIRNLGWSSDTDFESKLKEVVAWYIEHGQWLKETINNVNKHIK
jgi:dTDP-glucose 4,6-dehydratase